MPGPLTGLRIIEFAGIGPGPFCGMMLADHGADVIRIERPGQPHLARDTLLRSRRSIALNLRSAEGIEIARKLCASADGIIEGFRPGVMERLGLGPDVLLGDNGKLVYGRMTGWGQTGPLAHTAGHDINYIAISGVLSTIGRKGEPPLPPVNYVGDFGGGAMMLAFGMLAALLSVKNGQPGQVVDCAMTEGSALLAAIVGSLERTGMWPGERGENLLDTGAPFYEVYACADGEFVAVGAIEPQFWAILKEKAELDDPVFDAQMDMSAWPEMKEKLRSIFATRTRDEWCALLDGTDACFSPVLSRNEAQGHPHNVARQAYINVDGTQQPAPAPRYSSGAFETPRPAVPAGADTESLLEGLGFSRDDIEALKSSGVVAS